MASPRASSKPLRPANVALGLAALLVGVGAGALLGPSRAPQARAGAPQRGGRAAAGPGFQTSPAAGTWLPPPRHQAEAPAEPLSADRPVDAEGAHPRSGFWPPSSPAEGCLPPTFAREGAGRDDAAQAFADFVDRYPEVLLQPRAFASTLNLVPSLDVMKIRPTDVVLDLGCGTGALEMRLLAESRTFAHLYALDIDRASIRFLTHALRRCTRPDAAKIEPLHTFGERVDCPPASVDRAIIFNTPIGAPDPSGRYENTAIATQRCLTSLRRCLKLGGTVYYEINANPAMIPQVSATFKACKIETVAQEVQDTRSFRLEMVAR